MIKIYKVELNSLKISKIVLLLIYYLCNWHVTIAATAITTSTIPPQAKPIIAPVLSPSSLVSVLPTTILLLKKVFAYEKIILQEITAFKTVLV